MFFKSRGILNEDGYILFVRKNAIIVLIPKFGLEGTVFFDKKDKRTTNLVFDEEVKNQPRLASVTSKPCKLVLKSVSTVLYVQGPTLKVEQHTFAIFDKVKVTISLDDSNIQHQKIRMALIEPVVSTSFHQDICIYVQSVDPKEL